MDNIMQFPETFEEFAKSYGFKDSKEIYTNGSELIPVFRVEQWLEHARVERTCHIVPMDAAGNPPYRKGDLIMNSLSDGCSECGCPFDTLNYGVPNYCKNCGAKVVK